MLTISDPLGCVLICFAAALIVALLLDKLDLFDDHRFICCLLAVMIETPAIFVILNSIAQGELLPPQGTKEQRVFYWIIIVSTVVLMLLHGIITGNKREKATHGFVFGWAFLTVLLQDLFLYLCSDSILFNTKGLAWLLWGALTLFFLYLNCLMISV